DNAFHLRVFAKGGSAFPKTMVDKSPKAQDLRYDPHERRVELNLGGRAATCFANALRTTRSTLHLPRVEWLLRRRWQLTRRGRKMADERIPGHESQILDESLP